MMNSMEELCSTIAGVLSILAVPDSLKQKLLGEFATFSVKIFVSGDTVSLKTECHVFDLSRQYFTGVIQC